MSTFILIFLHLFYYPYFIPNTLFPAQFQKTLRIALTASNPIDPHQRTQIIRLLRPVRQISTPRPYSDPFSTPKEYDHRFYTMVARGSGYQVGRPAQGH